MGNYYWAKSHLRKKIIKVIKIRIGTFFTLEKCIYRNRIEICKSKNILKIKKNIHSKYLNVDAEEELRITYRATKEKILKMSIYDNSSGADVSALLAEFINKSGRLFRVGNNPVDFL